MEKETGKREKGAPISRVEAESAGEWPAFPAIYFRTVTGDTTKHVAGMQSRPTPAVIDARFTPAGFIAFYGQPFL